MRQELKHFPLWQAVGMALVGLVFYLSLTPNPVGVPVESGDKIGHLLAYFTLVFWFSQLYLPPRHLRLLVLFIAMGVVIEFLQAATGYRTFQLADMAANTLGAGAGYLLARTSARQMLQRFERRFL